MSLVNSWRLTRKQRLIGCIVLCAVFCALITLWGLYCLHEKGDFFFNTNHKNMASAFYGERTMSWDEFWGYKAGDFQSFSDVILRDPVLVLSRTLRNVYLHLLADMDDLLGWHVGIFLIPGIILTILGKPTSRQWIYYVCNVLLFGVLLWVFYLPRFSIPLIPFYAMLALRTFTLVGAGYDRQARGARW